VVDIEDLLATLGQYGRKCSHRYDGKFVTFEAENYHKCATCSRKGKNAKHGFHVISRAKPDIRKPCTKAEVKKGKGCSWGEISKEHIKHCVKKYGSHYIKPEVNSKGQQIYPHHDSNMAGGKAILTDQVSSKKATVQYKIKFPSAGRWYLYARASAYESGYKPSNKNSFCNNYGNEDSMFVPGRCLFCQKHQEKKINLGKSSHRKMCSNSFKNKGKYKDSKGRTWTFLGKDTNIKKRKFPCSATSKKMCTYKKEKDAQKKLFNKQVCWTNSPFDKTIDMELVGGSTWHAGGGNKHSKNDKNAIFAEGNYGWFRMMRGTSSTRKSMAYTVTKAQAGKAGIFTMMARERGMSIDRFAFVKEGTKISMGELDTLPNTQ